MSNDPQRRVSHNDSIENNKGEKRRINIPPSCYFHLRRKRKRRRHLVVPKTERDLSVLEDAYCDDNDGHQKQYGAFDRKSVSSCDTSASSSQRSSRRSLPSTQVLISMMNETTSKRNTKTNTISTSTSTSTRSSATNKSLLLRKFYESVSVGMKDHPSNGFTVTRARPMEEKESVRSDKTRARQAIDEIDDPSLSTLKIGHHKRYLQLTTNSNHQQTSKRTLAQRKELGKLNQMILKEQALYRLALDKFHDCYKSRYLIGFVESSSSSSDGNTTTDGKSTTSASAFCRWACFQAQAINREWEKIIVVHANSTDPKPSEDGKNSSVHTNKSKHTRDSQPLPKCYGKVRQTFALHSRTQQSSLDAQDLTCSVVYESKPTSQLSSSSSSSSSLSEKIKEFSPKDAENNQDGGTFRKIPPPTTDSAPVVRLLRNDPKALELAAKYSATIVTTSETLETLLRLPGDRSSKWMLPCATRTVSAPNSGPESTSSSSISVTILDLPIAQAFSSPRSCLEMGLQEGLYQAFLKQQHQPASQAVETSSATQNGKEKQGGASTPVSQVVYSLWTLPTKNVGVKNGSRKPIRVIVRTLVRLRDSVSKLPVRLRARVEYFSTPVNSEGGDTTRGGGGSNSRSRREIPNSYEKSLWILDQVLFGHQVFCLQYRIDPTTCGIVGWDATSVAHAFAASATDGIPGAFKSHNSDLGPLDHWKALIQLLQSIPSIDMPETLLCLPGRIGERKKTANDTNREILLGEETISTIPTDCQTQQQQQVRLDPFSVSVHAPCEDLLASKSRQSQKATTSFQLSSPSPSSTVTISLDKSALDQAGAVILGDQALRDCRREWEWDRSGQVPNTYPVVDTME